MWADPAVTRYILGTPSSPQQTWSRMLAYAGHWTFLGFGYWAVIDRASATFVGELGFADFKRDLAPDVRGVPEIGWALASHAQGRGLATEALRAALAWGDAHLDASRTIALIDPDNAPSLRVAENVGYRKLRDDVVGGRSTAIFVRERA